MGFDGFISYSHAADGRLAPAVQRGLHRLAKPWHRRRALWIFRDQTGLSVTPGLWSSIQRALDDSQYFVLLASPEAARSTWVNREIERWVATKSADQILPVVTDGVWRWDPKLGDFSEESTAVPAALRGVFPEEPLYLDLRWARDEAQLSLRHSRFRDAIAQLAAPMHGLSKDELEGEDVRQHRRARRLQSTAIAALVLLTLAAVLTGLLAVRNAGRANAAAAEARRQQQVAAEQHSSAQRSAQEAQRQQQLAAQEQTRAKKAAAETVRQQQLARQQRSLAGRAASEAGRQERLAREQKALAEQAAADGGRQKQYAKRQQVLADRAAARATQQQRLAEEQRELAQRWADEASQQEEAAKEQQRVAQQATDQARQQKARAEEQQRIAVARRLINDAKASLEEDPKVAMRLGAAAQTIRHDAETRNGLVGLVSSTHYSGTVGDAQSAAFGTDSVLATVNNDATVSLWNVADRANPSRLATLPGLAGVSSMIFSPDRQTLGAVDSEGIASLWDVTDPARPVRNSELPDKVFSLIFSPDGRTIATDDRAPSTTLWNVTDRKRPTRLATLSGDFYGEVGYAFSPNGRVLTVTTGENTTTVWDVADRAHPVKAATFSHVEAVPSSVAFAPNRSVLAVGYSNGTVVMWDVTNPVRPLRGTTMTGHAGWVRSVVFSADGRILASGDDEGTVTLWDMSDPQIPLRLDSLTDYRLVERLAFSPDGQTLAIANGLEVTLVSTVPAGSPKRIDLIGDAGVLAAAKSADGRSLVTALDDGTAAFWDLTEPAHPVRRSSVSVSDGGIQSAALSADGRIVAAASDGRITLSDIADPRRSVTLATVDQDLVVPLALWLSPDGSSLVATDKDGRLRIWDLTDRRRPQQVATLIGDGGTSVLPVAFSPDGRILAARDSERRITLWDLTDRAAPVRLAALAHIDVGVTFVAFSPDGHTLATGTTSHTAILWDVTDPTHPHQLSTLSGRKGWVGWIAFSPDGRVLTTDDESGMRLWDITDRANPVRLATLQPDGIPVFGPDGRTLAVWDFVHRGLAFWDFRPTINFRADPANLACTIAGRGLTPEEWSRYIPELPYQPTCSG